VEKGQKGFPIEYWSEQPFYQRRDIAVSHAGRPVNVLLEDRDDALIQGQGSNSNRQRVRVNDLVVRHDSKVLTWREAHERLDRWVARVSTVFNVEQCNGLSLDPIEAPPKTTIDKVERAEQLMASMRADGLSYATDNRGAYYVPKLDTVYLPEPERFRSSEAYYGTALHEIGHATGAEERLNREGITGDHYLGSEAYAREELRAELFSVFMAAETGISHDVSQHRAYIQHWGKILKADKHEIFRAAAQAGTAVDYVLEKEQKLLKSRVQAAEVEKQEFPSHEPELSVTTQERSRIDVSSNRSPHTLHARNQALER
jgi:antirestriction protein ArdC